MSGDQLLLNALPVETDYSTDRVGELSLSPWDQLLLLNALLVETRHFTRGVCRGRDSTTAQRLTC